MKRHPDSLLPCVLDGRATRDIEPGEVVKVPIRRGTLLLTAGERLSPGIIPLQLGPDGRVYQWGGEPGNLLVLGVSVRLREDGKVEPSPEEGKHGDIILEG